MQAANRKIHCGARLPWINRPKIKRKMTAIFFSSRLHLPSALYASTKYVLAWISLSGLSMTSRMNTWITPQMMKMGTLSLAYSSQVKP